MHKNDETINYKNIKKHSVFDKIATVIVILLLGYVSLPWTLLIIHGIVEKVTSEPEPAVPAPEITYGEFPVELVYEIDGETVTVSDIYVCEYEGYSNRRHDWNAYMKSTGEPGFVLHKDLLTKVYCRVGYDDYYMGEDVGEPEMEAVVIYEDFSGSGVLFPAELYEKYKIKLISWTMPEPIENSFPEGYTQ